jgi:hypothetical protein
MEDRSDQRRQQPVLIAAGLPEAVAQEVVVGGLAVHAG